MNKILDIVIDKVMTIVVLIIAIPIAFKLLFVNVWVLMIGGLLLLAGYLFLVKHVESKSSSGSV